jgi:signal transduction histidine kinase
VIGRARLTVGSWSTFGQTALLIIAALFLAQLFTFFLTRNVIDQWQTTNVVEPAIHRFADVAQHVAQTPADRREDVVAVARQAGERFWLTREMHNPSAGRQKELEGDLSAALKKRSVPFSALVVMRHDFGGWHFLPTSRPPDHGAFGGPQPRAFGDGPDQARHNPSGSGFEALPPDHGDDDIRLAAELPDGTWLAARFRVFKPFPMILDPLFLSQIALFVILLAATLFWAARISRPLRILAEAAKVLRPQVEFQPIPVEGPREVRVAIDSFNTMAQRVRDLLMEKDRMLSAIGHDLRTPLASLRIRAESVEPESERDKFIETIDEMTAMVEEILGLARLAHSTEPKQLVDLSALADAVVEEFRGLGKDVTFIEAPRITVTMQVNLVRRLLRNLIDNAVKYGMRAQVSLCDQGGAVELVIEDEGPGIPAGQLGEVLQPFTRLDCSRSRTTGGIGLGLSIADAIAKSQGATLILDNREGGGLRAIVKWTPTD